MSQMILSEQKTSGRPLWMGASPTGMSMGQGPRTAAMCNTPEDCEDLVQNGCEISLDTFLDYFAPTGIVAGSSSKQVWWHLDRGCPACLRRAAAIQHLLRSYTGD